MFKPEIQPGEESASLLKEDGQHEHHHSSFPLPASPAAPYAHGLPPPYDTEKQEASTEPPPVPSSSYKDVLFAVAFFINTLALVAVLIACYDHQPAAPTSDETVQFNSIVMWAIAVAGVVSIFSSIAYLVIVHIWTREALWMGIWMNLLCIVATLVYSLMHGNMVMSIISVVMLPIFVCWVKAVQGRIKLATEMVQISLSVTKRFWGVYYNLAFFTGLGLCFVALWSYASYSVYQLAAKNEPTNAAPPATMPAAAVWLLFTLLWGLYTLQYITHLTTSGTLAAWYFEPDTEANLTTQSLQRATTTSLGSACFAALVIAVIDTMEQMAAYARSQLNRNSDRDGGVVELVACFVLCCFECLLRILGVQHMCAE
jgi:hypothetical protein